MTGYAVMLLAATALLAGPALAASKKQAPETKATEIHGAPGNTPGFGGSSANPNGIGRNGGGGIRAKAAPTKPMTVPPATCMAGSQARPATAINVERGPGRMLAGPRCLPPVSRPQWWDRSCVGSR